MTTLLGFDESAEQAYQTAINEPLGVKITKAIDFLQFNEVLHGGEGYYLAFSGGKDSIVIHWLAEMAGVKFDPWYNNVTIDPPELVRFIQREYSHVSWSQPEKNLVMKMADKSNGPPTRLARWCCGIYKEQGGTGRVKIIGVRAPESPRRKNKWRQIVPNRNTGTILCPVLYWTDSDVWNFIRQYGLKYCSLYDEGFKRLGCVGCPMGGRKGRLRDFARWPRYETLWKLGFQRYWARWKGVPRRDGKPRWIEKFDRWEQLWSWWMEEPESNEDGEECQMRSLFI